LTGFPGIHRTVTEGTADRYGKLSDLYVYPDAPDAFLKGIVHTKSWDSGTVGQFAGMTRGRKNAPEEGGVEHRRRAAS
jgi:hypothetical protein